MAKNKFLRKTIINGNGKSRIEKELIVDDFGGLSNANTLARDGRTIVRKHYVFSCGEVGESERGRYNKKDSMYFELNKQLLAAGL